VLSHQSAALAHGLRLPVDPRTVHVTVTDSDRSRPGIHIHTTSLWLPGDHYRLNGLQTTSVERTMVDIAPDYRNHQLAPLVDHALQKTSRTKLLAAVDRHPGRPGTPRLRLLLDPKRPSAEAWSRREAQLRAALIRAGLPVPESNVAIGRYVADLLWREQRVIVEYDDAFTHDLPGPFHSDRSRHNDLSAVAGYKVIHVTDQHLFHELEQIIVWVTIALHRGGGW
jgi:very-short-patch-repair endonuclease